MINNYKNIIHKAKNIKSGDPPLSDDEIIDMIGGKGGGKAIPGKFTGFLTRKSTILIIAGLMMSVFSVIYSYNALFNADEFNDPQTASNSSIEINNNNAASSNNESVIVKKDAVQMISPAYETQNKNKQTRNKEPRKEIAFSGNYQNNYAFNEIKNKPEKVEADVRNDPLHNDITELLGIKEKTFESTNFGVSLLYGGGFLTNNLQADYLKKSPAQMYFADIVFNFSIPFKNDQYLRFDLGYSPNVYGISVID